MAEMIGIARRKNKHAHFPSILAATTAEWTVPGLEKMVSVLPLLPCHEVYPAVRNRADRNAILR